MLPGKGFFLDSVHKGFPLLELVAHDMGPCWNKAARRKNCSYQRENTGDLASLA